MPTQALKDVLAFLDMLATFTTTASQSVSVTGNESLPPYPALGLAWMMHATQRPFPTLTEIQALHQLASSAALPATAKILADTARGRSKVPMGLSPIPLNAAPTPAPSGPGIAIWDNVLIKPCPPVMLSQASLKDHPQKPRIISIAKTLFDSDSPKARAARSGKDYLQQALNIVNSTSPGQNALHTVSFTNALSLLPLRRIYLLIQVLLLPLHGHFLRLSKMQLKSPLVGPLSLENLRSKQLFRALRSIQSLPPSLMNLGCCILL